MNGQGQVSSAPPSAMVILSMSKPETYVESSSRNKSTKVIIESLPKKACRVNRGTRKGRRKFDTNSCNNPLSNIPPNHLGISSSSTSSQPSARRRPSSSAEPQPRQRSLCSPNFPITAAAALAFSPAPRPSHCQSSRSSPSWPQR